MVRQGLQLVVGQKERPESKYTYCLVNLAKQVLKSELLAFVENVAIVLDPSELLLAVPDAVVYEELGWLCLFDL